ncbi:MAG: 3-keto-5-aminohexanoate cleavage protein [Candidatus Limiplasma sp.]|nr:3-keto-5-aminohexanoate cleavage protein [Candidatus Limiplasma sp.]
MKKIMLSVAPVAASDILNQPRAIAREALACYQAGASMIHLHCRDLNGQLTDDLSLLEETVDYIREACPIVIEISTGGVSNLTIEQRCQPCKPDWIECNSLNVGSVNLGDAVYQNPIKDVRYCVEQILKYHKIPEIEVFEVGMINTVRELAQQYPFVKPILFAIVLGHGGAMPATVAALNTMLEGLYDNFPNREDTLWGITEAHRTGWDLIKVALDKGASTVRIGFEDSDYLNPTTRVDNNAAMMAQLSDIVKSKGMLPATPDEVRAMLHIPPRGKR